MLDKIRHKPSSDYTPNIQMYTSEPKHSWAEKQKPWKTSSSMQDIFCVSFNLLMYIEELKHYMEIW